MTEVIASIEENSPNVGPFRSLPFVGEAIQVMHEGKWCSLATNSRELVAVFEEHERSVGNYMHPFLWHSYIYNLMWVNLERSLTGKEIDIPTWEKGVRYADQHGMPIKWFLYATRIIHGVVRGDPGMTDWYDKGTDLLRQLGNPEMQESRGAIWFVSYPLIRHEEQASERMVSSLESWAVRLPLDRWASRYAKVHRALHDLRFENAGAERALEVLEEEAQGPRFRMTVHMHALLAEAHLARGNLREAERRAKRGLRLTVDDDGKRNFWDQIVARRVHANFLGPRDALRELGDVVELGRELRFDVEVGKALWHMSVLHERAGRIDESERFRREALEILRGANASACIEWLSKR